MESPDSEPVMLFEGSLLERFIDDFSGDDLADGNDEDDDDALFDILEDDSTRLYPSGTTILVPTTADDETSLEESENMIRYHTLGVPAQTQQLLSNRNSVISRIEEMLKDIVDGLLDGRESLTITLKSRANTSRRIIQTDRTNRALPEPKERVISFPGASAQEAWNFTVVLRVLELIHGGLVENIVMTKRDLYYRHPDLFVKQSVVDRYVDDIACTLSTSRSQLNVVAAAKGLVAGNFYVIRERGQNVCGLDNQEGMLVPTIGDHDTLDLQSIKWICVIEKEATFQSLLSSSSWKELGLEGMALTAKGYPDIASRKFLRQLANQAPQIPMYALMDYDPDGIAILSTYKHGSYRLAHEEIQSSGNNTLQLPAIHWLGVKSDIINQAGAGGNGKDRKDLRELQGCLKLTMRDRKKAVRMLEWDLCMENGEEQEWRHELQTMLMLNVKAEMQILDDVPGGLVQWMGQQLDQTTVQMEEIPTDHTGFEDGILF